jgi:excisionase family DNA binding protein
MQGTSEILSIAEVALVLRCSKAHVSKAIHGKITGVTPLPAISMGRRRLISRRSLESWLAQNDPVGAGVIMGRSHEVDAVNA